MTHIMMKRMILRSWANETKIKKYANFRSIGFIKRFKKKIKMWVIWVKSIISQKEYYTV